MRRAVPIPDSYFGEGITVLGDRIWELTYRDGVGVEWDKRTLTPLREVPFTREGWGLCNDGNRLISSEGTDRLRFLDPANLAETGAVNVTRDGQPLVGLNELECVDGQVWANVWPTDTIVRIDPASGAVTAVVDGSGCGVKAARKPGRAARCSRHRTHRGPGVSADRQELAVMFRVRIDALTLIRRDAGDLGGDAVEQRGIAVGLAMPARLAAADHPGRQPTRRVRPDGDVDQPGVAERRRCIAPERAEPVATRACIRCPSAAAPARSQIGSQPTALTWSRRAESPVAAPAPRRVRLRGAGFRRTGTVRRRSRRCWTTAPHP